MRTKTSAAICKAFFPCISQTMWWEFRERQWTEIHVQGDEESYKLLEDPDSPTVDRVAALLGMRKVGWIFTARYLPVNYSGVMFTHTHALL
jgi:hypothetical protein